MSEHDPSGYLPQPSHSENWTDHGDVEEMMECNHCGEPITGDAFDNDTTIYVYCSEKCQENAIEAYWVRKAERDSR